MSATQFSPGQQTLRVEVRGLGRGNGFSWTARAASKKAGNFQVPNGVLLNHDLAAVVNGDMLTATATGADSLIDIVTPLGTL